MSGPHFRIYRHSAGFNAVPISVTGWFVTIGMTIVLLIASLLLVIPLVKGLINLPVYLVILVIISGLYCWALIAYAIKNGETIDHR